MDGFRSYRGNGGERERRRLRTLQAELKTINMTREEAKRAAKDRERSSIAVRAPCSRENDEE